MNIDLASTLIAITIFFGISALMALSLNLEYGITGVPNFGQAMFVSIGAYVTGITYTRLLPLLAGQEVIYPCGTNLGAALQLRTDIMRNSPAIGAVNILITFVIAAIIGGLTGYVISYIFLRLKEEWYLALVLLVGGEILRIVIRGYEPVICASNGISGIAQPFYWLREPRLSSILFAGFILVIVALTYFYCERLLHSPYGRLLKAVRENEVAARSLGKDVNRIRAQIMMIGSMIAAISGVLFALNLGFVNTNDYVVTLTLDVWVMVVLGGLGNNRGALLGALLITLLDRITAIFAIQFSMMGSEFEFNYLRYIIFGVILLVMLRYRPQGILPERPQTTLAHQYLAEKAE